MKTRFQIDITLDKIVEALKAAEKLQKKNWIKKHESEDMAECRECIVGALLIIEDIKSSYHESWITTYANLKLALPCFKSKDAPNGDSIGQVTVLSIAATQNTLPET